MNKALLLSIKPEHAIKILKGEKTLELRKSVPKGFKGWVYVYVTKAKPYFFYKNGYGNFWALENKKMGIKYEKEFDDLANGTIPFRFWFDEYENLHFNENDKYKYWYQLKGDTYIPRGIDWLLKELCLTTQQVLDYGKGKDLYAWHIKNLKIFDESMKLSEFIKNWDIFDTDSNGKYVGKYIQIISYVTKAPQSYQYVWVKEEGK